MNKKRDFLTLEEFSLDEIMSILARAEVLKEQQKESKEHKLLAGKSLVLIFEKPSTRTRVSFEVGIFQLGACPISLGASEMQLGRGETIEDTARVLSCYVDGIIIRTFAHQKVEKMAKAATIPVINALSDEHHPCQALSDLFTIKEKKGDLSQLNLSYLGDGNNVCHSLLLAAAKVGMNMTVASPKDYTPRKEIVEKAQMVAAATGSVIKIVESAEEAAKEADILYTDVWVSMGDEAQAKERLKALKPYQINQAIVSLAKKDALVMHCLPAHKGQEITEKVFEGPQSIVFDQAENRLHAQKALLVELL